VLTNLSFPVTLQLLTALTTSDFGTFHRLSGLDLTRIPFDDWTQIQCLLNASLLRQFDSITNISRVLQQKCQRVDFITWLTGNISPSDAVNITVLVYIIGFVIISLIILWHKLPPIFMIILMAWSYGAALPIIWFGVPQLGALSHVLQFGLFMYVSRGLMQLVLSSNQIDDLLELVQTHGGFNHITPVVCCLTSAWATLYWNDPLMGYVSVILLFVCILNSPSVREWDDIVIHFTIWATTLPYVGFMTEPIWNCALPSLSLFGPGILTLCPPVALVGWLIISERVYWNRKDRDLSESDAVNAAWADAFFQIILITIAGIYWSMGIHYHIAFHHYLGMAFCLAALWRGLLKIFDECMITQTILDDIWYVALHGFIYFAILGAWVHHHPSHFISN
jgi:hypothetical protein